MASELSSFIESELRSKGYACDDADEAENATLIGALRVEARVKDQETQKKLFNIKRIVCIGGGVALVLVAWALLIASSKDRSDPAYDAALRQFEGITVDGRPLNEGRASSGAGQAAAGADPAAAGDTAAAAAAAAAGALPQPAPPAGQAPAAAPAAEKQQQQQLPAPADLAPPPAAAAAANSTAAGANATAAPPAAAAGARAVPPPAAAAAAPAAANATAGSAAPPAAAAAAGGAVSNASAAADAAADELDEELLEAELEAEEAEEAEGDRRRRLLGAARPRATSRRTLGARSSSQAGGRGSWLAARRLLAAAPAA